MKIHFFSCNVRVRNVPTQILKHIFFTGWHYKITIWIHFHTLTWRGKGTFQLANPKNRSLWFPRLIRNSRPKKNVCLTFRIFCCWRLDDVNIVGILCRSQKTFIFFRNFLCRHDFHKNCFCHKKLISRRFLTIFFQIGLKYVNFTNFLQKSSLST